MGPRLQGRLYPRFRTCIFKSHSLASMWPVLVEFRSADELKKKKKIEEEKIAQKPKSADDYVGRL